MTHTYTCCMHSSGASMSMARSMARGTSYARNRMEASQPRGGPPWGYDRYFVFTATHCNTLQHAATLRKVAFPWRALNHDRDLLESTTGQLISCNTLQHNATRCKTPESYISLQGSRPWRGTPWVYERLNFLE